MEWMNASKNPFLLLLMVLFGKWLTVRPRFNVEPSSSIEPKQRLSVQTSIAAWFLCVPRFRMLKFNPHFEIIRGWNLNPTMMFRSRAFGRQLGLDKAILVELQDQILDSIYIGRGRENRIDRHVCCLLSCNALHQCGALPARSLSDAACWPFISRTMSQNELFFIEELASYSSCDKWTNTRNGEKCPSTSPCIKPTYS